MSSYEHNKYLARFALYLRLLQLLSLLPADAPPKWQTKRVAWENESRRLAGLLLRGFEHDRVDFSMVVADAVKAGVVADEVVGKAPHFTRSQRDWRVERADRIRREQLGGVVPTL